MPRALVLLLLLTATPAFPGVVRTLDGQTLEGDIRLDTNSLLISSPARSTRVELQSILSAHFRNDGPAVKWTARDIGPVALPGSARLTGNTLVVRASGANMVGNQDECYFFYQSLPGDGQIVARVASLTQSDRMARAGIMFRASIDPAAPCAMALVYAAEGAAMHVRARHDASARVLKGPGGNPPLYLKLLREGSHFTAFSSADGETWDTISTQVLAINGPALVGLAVCARNKNALCTAVFDRISVRTAAAAAIGQAPAGVVLRDGSFIGGRILRADESAVTLARDDAANLTFPMPSLARLRLSPLPRENVAPLTNAPGVLLTTGDFCEGNITSLADNHVTVSNVLFGLQRFPANQVSLVLYRPLTPPNRQYELRLADGSLLHVDRLTLEKNALVAELDGVGKLRAPATHLTELRAGAARFQSLADLKPARATGPVATDATTCGLPMVLGGKRCARGVGLGGGGEVTYDLNGQYRSLLLRLGVPDGILPTTSVRFRILADNKEIHHGTPRTSLDEPLTLTLNLIGVKSLVFRLDSPPAPLGSAGLLGDPALLR